LNYKLIRRWALSACHDRIFHLNQEVLIKLLSFCARTYLS